MVAGGFGRAGLSTLDLCECGGKGASDSWTGRHRKACYGPEGVSVDTLRTAHGAISFKASTCALGSSRKSPTAGSSLCVSGIAADQTQQYQVCRLCPWLLAA